jgi:hypothetical protein
MTAKWLALRNLRRNQEILKAINTLSLQLHLQGAGGASHFDPDTLATAQRTLVDFLTQLRDGLKAAEASETGLIYGVDPRFQAFVGTYQAVQAVDSTSPLAVDLSTIQREIEAATPTDPAGLLAYLTALRGLIEAEIKQDVTQAL